MIKNTVVFDLDGTLIYEVGEKEDTPRYEVIDLFLSFQRFGCEMYLWSGGGEEYCDSWLKRLGLNAKVVEKGSFIPDIAVDNESCFLGKVNIRV